MNKKEKKKIEAYLQNMELDKVEKMLECYKKQTPYDRDLLSFASILHLYNNNLEEAYKLGKQGIQKFPTSVEMYYNLAAICEAKEEILKAIKYYQIALFLYNKITTKTVEEEIILDISNRISILEKEIPDLLKLYTEKKNRKKLLELEAFLGRWEFSVFGKSDDNPRSDTNKIIGREIWIQDNEKRYIGLYRTPLYQLVGEENLDLIHSQGEFLKTSKGKYFIVNGKEDEFLLPIASSEEGNIHEFYEDGKIYRIRQEYNKRFNYYRVKNNTQISSKKLSYYGELIPLKHNDNRKKLVINLFVDGLTQEIIQGDLFESLMPNTYRFFKEGIICTNAYTCADWTLPSIATYNSGLTMLEHMMFHNKIDGEFPENITTLSEYFKKEGYYTAKIDGGWRSTYSYGYARGVNQYIYQHQWTGARAEQEIGNIIEHIETFKETDQYLWMAIGDLHDIADGIDLSGAVQSRLTLEERQMEEEMSTSVKQKYSKQKASMYKKCASYLDTLLEGLFSYILCNYKEEEILISLFGDHGQGYLVPDGKPFLSKERTKVAFMFRGGVESCVSDEMISTADYLPIMCHLAGIEVDRERKISGKLPKAFGGEEEREYTLTESLHPNDPYYAVINTKEYEIFFENGSPTDDEGRFYLKDYKIFGFNKNGEEITDKVLLKRYEDIIVNRIAGNIIYE